jgi:hypothetical protein
MLSFNIVPLIMEFTFVRIIVTSVGIVVVVDVVVVLWWVLGLGG